MRNELTTENQLGRPSHLSPAPLISKAAVTRPRARLHAIGTLVHNRLRSAPAALLGLSLSGVALELALLAWWVRAFSLAGHPGFPAPTQDALLWTLGDGATGVRHFTLLLIVAFLPYYIAVLLAGRACGRIALTVALGGAVLLGGTMLTIFPAGAIDIFHNIMDGRLFWGYHQNPMVVAPFVVSSDPLYPYLHFWQFVPSAYGPLWFLLTAPAYLAGGNSLLRNMVAYKVLPFAFELVSLALIVLIVRRIEPQRVVAAVVCFGWNPLVLWEIAGNGHNDIVMMSFVLLAILLLLTERWPIAFPVLIGSVLVKFISLILLPVFVLWILLRYGRRALLPLINGSIAAALVALVLFRPFWEGSLTFTQLRDQQNQMIFSPASALVGNWGLELANTARLIDVKNGLTAAFVLLYLVALLRLRPSAAGLVRTCVEVIFLLLVLMTWWFWPWYVIWGLALAALLPGTVYLRLFVLFSTTAMLIYVSSSWRTYIWNFSDPVPMTLGTALLVFLPLILYAVMHVWERADLPA